MIWAILTSSLGSYGEQEALTARAMCLWKSGTWVISLKIANLNSGKCQLVVTVVVPPKKLEAGFSEGGLSVGLNITLALYEWNSEML